MMTRMAAGSEIWLYMYDADDERVWAFKEGANPRFDRWTLRDLDGKVLRTYEATGYVWSWSEDHVHRGGTLLASVTPSGTTHLHTDHLGTPRASTNASGTRTAYHVYYPFGEEATSITQDTQRMKFTGHERDLGNLSSAADDLDYMHARFYNPQVGRFLSTDPVNSARATNPQSWNRYTYALNNPVRIVDPNGESPVVILVAAGIVGGLIFGAEAANAPESADTPTIENTGGMKAMAASSVVIGIVKAAMTAFGLGEEGVGKTSETQTEIYAPDRDLPRNEHGEPVPDTDAPHTQLGQRTSSRTGERYPQAREFDATGRPTRDVDFTNHGRPKDHPNPHQHRYDPQTGKRLPAEPLPEEPKPPRK